MLDLMLSSGSIVDCRHSTFRMIEHLGNCRPGDSHPAHVGGGRSSQVVRSPVGDACCHPESLFVLLDPAEVLSWQAFACEHPLAVARCWLEVHQQLEDGTAQVDPMR